MNLTVPVSLPSSWSPAGIRPPEGRPGGREGGEAAYAKASPKTPSRRSRSSSSRTRRAARRRLPSPAQERLGNLDEAVAALTKAQGMTTGAGKAEVLAALARMDLLRGIGKDAPLPRAGGGAGAATRRPPWPPSRERRRARTEPPRSRPRTRRWRRQRRAPSPTRRAARPSSPWANDDAAAAFRKALELDPEARRCARVARRGPHHPRQGGRSGDGGAEGDRDRSQVRRGLRGPGPRAPRA